jgi:F0F1-type ATP synthase epsilon subunit
MSDTFKLELVTPNSYTVFDNVKSISAESELGDFTALSNHERYMIKLKPCIIDIMINSTMRKKYFINNGVIKIRPAIYCIIAEEIKDINDISDDFIKNYPDKKIADKIHNMMEKI